MSKQAKPKLFSVIPVPFLPTKLIELLNTYQLVLVYGIIGVSALFIDLFIYWSLINGAEFSPLASNTVSVFTAMIFSFGLNARYNFKQEDNVGKRFAMFALVTFIGYLVSQVIIYALFDVAGYSENLAKIATLPPVFIVQYLLNKKFTFKETIKEQEVNTTSLKNKKVAVIGGGFTGLTAAYELAKRGATVELHESTDRLGGLVTGFELKDGTPLEMAYHFLYKTDEHIIGLAEELGVIDTLNFYPTKIGAFYKNELMPFNTALDLLKFKPLSFVNRIRTGLTGVRLMTVRNWRPLTQITAYDWLVKYNGKTAADIVWKPLLQGKFENYWDQVTMAWLWTRIKVRQDSQDALGQEKLGYFDGGFRVIVDSIVASLEASDNVSIHLNSTLTASSYNDKTNKATITIGGKKKSYDAVLSTIPSPVFGKLNDKHPDMTKKYQKQLTSIDYLGALLQVFTTKKPITEYYWHQIHDQDAPFLVLLSLDSLVGPEKVGGNYVYYIGDYLDQDSKFFNASTKTIEKKWFDGVQQLFPEFDRKDVIESHVFKFRNAQHVVGIDYEDKLPAYRTPLRGHYLANFSQIFPEDRGTNYAVREGKLITAMIEEDILSNDKKVPAKKRTAKKPTTKA